MTILCRHLFVLIGLLALASNVQAQIEITDSHGKYRFAKPPERVVVLNWALAEQMIELGEMPVGMSDIEGYHHHTGVNSVPESVQDIGGRMAPGMRAIRELKPDIILIGYSQRPFIRSLSNIATVIYFKNFGKRYNNGEKSEERFLELAKLFEKTEFANQKLRQRNDKLASLKAQLQAAYQDKPLPAVQFIVPESSAAAKRGVSLVFGENSLPFYAAQALGLTVVGAEKNNQFGIARLNQGEISDLNSSAKQEVCQFTLSSYTSSNFDENGASECNLEMEYQNAFGGVMSILYLAESISKALVERLPE